MTTPNTTTFRAWLRAQRDRDDAVGDLARDVESDAHCIARSPQSLIVHVSTRSGWPPAIAAARRAADQWARTR